MQHLAPLHSTQRSTLLSARLGQSTTNLLLRASPAVPPPPPAFQPELHSIRTFARAAAQSNSCCLGIGGGQGAREGGVGQAGAGAGIGDKEAGGVAGRVGLAGMLQAWGVGGDVGGDEARRPAPPSRAK